MIRTNAILRAALGTAFAAALTLAGCDTTPAASTPPATFEVLGSAAPGAELAIDATMLEPMTPGVARWQVVGAGELAVTTEATADGATRTEPRAVRTLSRAPDGAVLLDSQTDVADGSTTRFDPPVVLAPGVLRTGEEPACGSAVITERGELRDRDGSAQRSLRIAATDRVRTPLGEFEAIRVDSVFAMKMKYASLRRETSTWVRPGVGPVAVRSEERILVMGVVPRKTSETRVLLPGTGGGR
jgi:hypothetical protein